MAVEHFGGDEAEDAEHDGFAKGLHEPGHGLDVILHGFGMVGAGEVGEAGVIVCAHLLGVGGLKAEGAAEGSQVHAVTAQSANEAAQEVLSLVRLGLVKGILRGLIELVRGHFAEVFGGALMHGLFVELPVFRAHGDEALEVLGGLLVVELTGFGEVFDEFLKCCRHKLSFGCYRAVVPRALLFLRVVVAGTRWLVGDRL